MPHTYPPEITALVPQTIYSLQYNEDTVSSHQFSLHQVYMTNADTPPTKTSLLYNVQLTSHTSKPRIFPSLPYTTENLKIAKNSTSSSLILQTLSILHFVICYSNTKHVMQHIKMMLAKLQLFSFQTKTQCSTYYTTSF